MRTLLTGIIQRSRTSRGVQARAAPQSHRRWYPTDSHKDLAIQLQSDLRTALKKKDYFTATTIRSVLAEVYAAQKQISPTVLKSSEIVSIIRKAQQRRLDSVRQYESASRSDLAKHEKKEAALLASYMPSTLPITEIDSILRRIIADISGEENTKKAKGLALKAFYSQVDKNTVPGELVRQRLDELWFP